MLVILFGAIDVSAQRLLNSALLIDGGFQAADTIIYGCDSEPSEIEFIEINLINEGDVVLNNLEILSSLGSDESSLHNVNTNIPINESSTVEIGPFDFKSPGTYVLSLSISTVNGSSDVNPSNDSVEVIVKVLEQVSITPMDDVYKCQEDDVTLSSVNTYISYEWSTGSLQRSTNVQDEGFYVLMVENQDGCVGYDTVQVINYEQPQQILPEDVIFCDGDSLLVSVDSSFVDVNWTGLNNYSQEQSILINEPGLYQVDVVDTNSCSYTDSIIVSEISLPSITYATIDSSVCEGDDFVVEYADTSYSYSWSNGNTGNEISHSDEGLFYVTITDINGCSVSDTINFNYLQLPNPSLGQDTEYCNVSDVTLAPGNFHSYQWSNNSLQSELVVNQSGTYSVTVVNDEGCVNYDEVAVEFRYAVVEFGQDTVICDGDVIVLSPQSSGNRLWDDGSNSNQRLINEGGNYWLTVQDGQCTESDTIYIEQKEVPVTEFETLESNLEVNLTNTSNNADSFHWTFGDGNTSTDTNPIHTYNTDGAYVVTLEAENICGVSQHSRIVTVSSLGIAELTIGSEISIYPNPASDFINLGIKDFSDRLEIEIYTELGQRLLYRDQYVTSGDNIQLDIQSLASGIYFVRLTSGSNVHTEPLYIR